MEVPEVVGQGEDGGRAIFEDIIAEKFLKWLKGTNPWIQEAQFRTAFIKRNLHLGTS